MEINIEKMAQNVTEKVMQNLMDNGVFIGSWIPVSERLPEDRESVLLSTKTNEVFEGSYFDDDTNRQWYSCRDETFIWNDIVTAWMPLPKPYKVESEDNV